MRGMSSCAIAPSTPTTMVIEATTRINVPGRELESRNSVWVRMMAYTPTLVSSPANTAVIGDGAVG